MVMGEVGRGFLYEPDEFPGLDGPLKGTDPTSGIRLC